MPCCKKDKDKGNPLESILAPFALSHEAMLDVSKKLDAAMTRGLEGTEDYDVRMFPTYISAVPNSKERGRFLSLDLGASRLIVSLVELRGKHISFKRSMRSVRSIRDSLAETKPRSLPSNMRWISQGISNKKNSIAYEALEIDLPPGIKTGSGEQLFQYIADRLKDFLTISSRLPSGDIALGFNFPCPCRRTGPGNGILTNWTKAYACEGVLGKDVAVMLQDALDRNELSHIKVEVLLNDTLATLLAGSYGPATNSVLVGVMLGTTTNAVFQQRLDQIPLTDFHLDTMEYYKTHVEKTMIVDTEWGAFGESTGDLDALRTDFDIQVDETSQNPGRDILTKMMCGMYTGEIVRLLLVKLNELKIFLRHGDGRPLLGDAGRWKLNHLHMSAIETDRGITFTSTKHVLAELGIKEVDHEACRVVKRVCEAVTARSAKLAGAGLAAIIKRVPRETVTIAIDGSLLRHHPTYRKRLEDSIALVLKMEPTKLVQRQYFSLKLISDGAIIGAGIAAACYARDRNTHKGFFASVSKASPYPTIVDQSWQKHNSLKKSKSRLKLA